MTSKVQLELLQTLAKGGLLVTMFGASLCYTASELNKAFAKLGVHESQWSINGNNAASVAKELIKDDWAKKRGPGNRATVHALLGQKLITSVYSEGHFCIVYMPTVEGRAVAARAEAKHDN